MIHIISRGIRIFSCQAEKNGISFQNVNVKIIHFLYYFDQQRNRVCLPIVCLKNLVISITLAFLIILVLSEISIYAIFKKN